MLPPVTVAFFTYSPSVKHERTTYAVACMRALGEHLRYSGGPLNWHLADDGSGEGHLEVLAEQLRTSTAVALQGELHLSWSDSQRRGYGASYNAMTNAVHNRDDDLILCVEDDWLLSRDFDLTALVSAMVASWEGDGVPLQCVRLGYLGWTKRLAGHLVRPYPGQTFLLLSPQSAEHHVFSAGPRIERVGFERRLGLWPEHVTAGPCELEVAGRPESREGVAWPLDQGVNAALDNPSLFAHIGTVSVKDEAVI